MKGGKKKEREMKKHLSFYTRQKGKIPEDVPQQSRGNFDKIHIHEKKNSRMDDNIDNCLSVILFRNYI